MSSSQIKDRTCVSCTGRWIFTSEPLGRPWYIINVTENRVWLFAAQKLIKRQNLWKGKSTSEANSRRGESTGWSGVQGWPPPQLITSGQGFHSFREGYSQAQWSPTVVLKSVMWGLLGVLLTVSSTVNLHPRVSVSPFLEVSSRKWGQLHHASIVWSSPVTSSACWAFSTCKTAHRTWLRVLSSPLQEELKVLNFVYLLRNNGLLFINNMYLIMNYFLVLFDYFPLLLHFLTSLIKLILWLNIS